MATLPFRNAEDGTLNIPEVTADEGRAWVPPILALSLSFIFKMHIFAYLFLAVLSLHCWASSGGFSCYRAQAVGPRASVVAACGLNSCCSRLKSTSSVVLPLFLFLAAMQRVATRSVKFAGVLSHPQPTMSR